MKLNSLRLKSKLYYVPKFSLSLEVGDHDLNEIEYTEKLDKLREITFWNIENDINLEECAIRKNND